MGGAGIGVAAMIIAELVGTVGLIALLIGWAERRSARQRRGTSVPLCPITATGSTDEVSRPRSDVQYIERSVDKQRQHRYTFAGVIGSRD